MRSLSLLLTLLTLTACSGPTLFEDSICITNINTIDAVNGLLPDQTVIIHGSKIIRVANTQDLVLDPKNKIIDGTDKFLIPGLWDAHVHFAFNEDLAGPMFDLFLAYGVTSVRDTGGNIDFLKGCVNEYKSNQREFPRIKIAGPLLDGQPTVYDGGNANIPELAVSLATIQGARDEVDRLDSLGVDFLKAYEMLSPKQFVSIANKAKRKGLPLTGHIPLSMDAITVSNAGISSIEHLRNIEMSMAKNSDELLAQRRKMLEMGKEEEGHILRSNIHNSQRREAILNQDEVKTKNVIDVFVKNNTWQVPTFMIMTSIVEKPYKEKEWQETFAYLPPDIEKKWIEGVASVMELEVTEDSKNYVDWFNSTVRKMNEAGVSFMAGTDCPIFYLTPGYSLHHELKALVKAGFTPLKAIEAATLNPAKYFKMENELGLISEGMYADLIILEANPLENIENTQTINSVFKHGNHMNRNHLDQLLKELDKGK